MVDTNQKVTKAIVVVPASSLSGSSHQKVERFSLYDVNGDPVPFEGLVVQDGDSIDLTGYALGVDVSAVADTDTLNEALSKLEARIVVLEP